ncbi:class I SAM-dependent methyltransferase [Leptospira biflexa]|uniref:class I SAM-dependent methyltransferase n=1 Tax=Leptospira biflexa TaxID=172 RepID=UPI001083A45E|nr:class I SAM-dependent methyltransferase [Leptospira biflexa]TGM37343.1 class I SAM-dependent methyltransferase [Leptospira biflexa]TGM40680.1 class I SAM-dependent methyltransferase [Leptospira biflexa]TGM46884.1 class I SAM-dependent methyltransferase [Leptospira biflexa]TGM50650.1 class I SAM-dependent methyltransferase [Leptospira biflexa]
MNRWEQTNLQSLVRIPEPELMEDTNQVKSYANADFESAHSMIIKQFQNRLPLKFSPRSVLDLGCGPGDMSNRLVTLFPNSNFTFLDGSNSMLDYCKKRLSTLVGEKRNNKMIFKNELIQGFVPESSYELVFSNSLLHHTHNPYEFWAAIQRSIDDDSFIFISDLLRPNSTVEVNQLVERYAKNESEILKTDFYNSLMAAFRLEEVADMIVTIRMSHKLNLEIISDRHWICYTKPR